MTTMLLGLKICYECDKFNLDSFVKKAQGYDMIFTDCPKCKTAKGHVQVNIKIKDEDIHG